MRTLAPPRGEGNKNSYQFENRVNRSGSHDVSISMKRYAAVKVRGACHPGSRMLGRAGAVGPFLPESIRLEHSILPRKEVIQPHVPVRLPCYDFTPLTLHTFDASAPRGFGRRLRVQTTRVV